VTPYYQDDLVTLHHGDCFDLLPKLEAPDHVITDPPYEDEAHTKQRRQSGGKKKGVEPAPLSFGSISESQRAELGRWIGASCKLWSLVFCQIEAVHKWHEAIAGGEARYVRTCIWIKPNGCPQFTGDRPGMGYETIIACHGPGKLQWSGGGRHGVFTHNVTHSKHPTGKPLPLMVELIKLFTNPGDLIIDPFAGSGTTLRAAKDLNRRAIGIELDEKFCKIAARRLRQDAFLFDPLD
jgi:site-specific DNA-methyltransferase (adenine-specific)